MTNSANKLKQLCEEKHPSWMGILNMTPDSFSDGGLFENVNSALRRAEQLIAGGADLLDIGGVSTRPGSEPVSEQEELSRILPIALNIRKNFPNILLSIDTFRPGIARALAEEGLVDLINDIYAGRIEEKRFQKLRTTIEVAHHFGLGIVLMHMQGEPKTMQQNPHYKNCIEEVCSFLRERASVASRMGVKFIAVDAGIGFGKRLQDNLALLSQSGIQACANLGYPLLVGLSRKRFLGELFHYDNEDMSIPPNRDKRSKELEWRCAELGATIIRSHKTPEEKET